MQQPCNKCGYESPESDRFCRQCGGQLSTENELTPTMTFNQAKSELNPPVASVGTGRFPPSVGDAIAGNTERYYSPPQYAPPPASIERLTILEPPKSEPFSWFKSFSMFMKGFSKFLLVAALLVATGLAVFFAQEADYARRRQNDAERARERPGRESANGRAQNAWDQIEEAILLAQEAEEKAAEAGATLTAGDDKPIDLDRFAYENAEVEAKITKQGNETLSLLTRQNFDTVQKFYENKFGKPVLQLVTGPQGNQRRKILFQASTQPPILIKVEELDRGPVKITILHSFLRFPRANEAQARM